MERQVIDILRCRDRGAGVLNSLHFRAVPVRVVPVSIRADSCSVGRETASFVGGSVLVYSPCLTYTTKECKTARKRPPGPCTGKGPRTSYRGSLNKQGEDPKSYKGEDPRPS